MWVLDRVCDEVSAQIWARDGVGAWMRRAMRRVLDGVGEKHAAEKDLPSRNAPPRGPFPLFSLLSVHPNYASRALVRPNYVLRGLLARN